MKKEDFDYFEVYIRYEEAPGKITAITWSEKYLKNTESTSTVFSDFIDWCTEYTSPFYIEDNGVRLICLKRELIRFFTIRRYTSPKDLSS